MSKILDVVTGVIVACFFLASCRNVVQDNFPKGKFTVEIQDKLKGKLLGVEKYNDKHRLVESVYYDADGNIQSKMTLAYEEMYPLRYLHQSTGQDTITFLSTYERKDDTIEVAHYSELEGAIEYVTKEVYEEGKLTSMLSDNEAGKSVTLANYDDQGNLTQIVEVLDEDTIYWETFLITYKEQRPQKVVASNKIQNDETTYHYSYENGVLLEVYQDEVKLKEVKCYNVVKPAYLTVYENYYFPKSDKEFDKKGNVVSHTVYEYQ